MRFTFQSFFTQGNNNNRYNTQQSYSQIATYDSNSGKFSMMKLSSFSNSGSSPTSLFDFLNRGTKPAAGNCSQSSCSPCGSNALQGASFSMITGNCSDGSCGSDTSYGDISPSTGCCSGSSCSNSSSPFGQQAQQGGVGGLLQSMLGGFMQMFMQIFQGLLGQFFR